ncbi:DNA-binding transcriptional regulator, MerR family [Dethiosulfatibacter aminovorans DSM 17477]|uniref:DNA-binding transcriptional regulator, MerR family n=1 Tax=Dethiosulfatibacter aminovorans DSM 17477 TaxID=1121476 RepID=A0A1M6MQC0_9FIRM|nr:MerR family transcriptional regulator [Dethiosulfatibacter aminovorans]SHJ85596.1 DNA-binding transcriptional regulator, MerR family [Dethiosulfatibacter aminovorans DSM 17477]
MNRRRFSIGEMSNLFGISKQTLRHYDKIGLFEPLYINEKTGYRYYELNQFYILLHIQELKQAGISLARIKEYIDVKDTGLLKNTLSDIEEDIDSQIKDLIMKKEVAKELRNYLSMIDSANAGNENRYFGLKGIENRFYIEIAIDFTMDQLNEMIELIIELLVVANENHGFKLTNPVFLRINKENLMSKKFNYYNGIGTIIESTGEENFHYSDNILKKCKYVYTYHYGSYSSMVDSYEALYNHITENKYVIAGDSIEIARVNALHVDNPKEFVTEIQIPIIE